MKNFLFFLIFTLISCEFKSQNKSYAGIREDKISEIKEFVKDKDYNKNIAVFIDFKIPSNRYRFFVYDLKNDKILEKGIVSHGSGSVISNSKELKFSNIKNSYKSSLGKYSIGQKYTGQFGTSYRLKGLDKTNSNAMKRAIVLHYYYCVPDKETDAPVCLSLGCPMLSPNFFKKVSKYIDASEKPMILYTFY